MNEGTPDKAQPFSIRLTKEERAVLQERARGKPLGVFIRGLILPEQDRRRPTRRQQPAKNAETLGQILGLLGRSHLSSNLNQIAKAANLGALPVTPETEDDIRRACRDVFAIRRLLLLALGMKVPGEDWSAARLSDLFGFHGDPQ